MENDRGADRVEGRRKEPHRVLEGLPEVAFCCA